MLTLTDLRKTFGKTVAVDGLSLSVRKGELFGLLGPNGAGKSTTVSLSVGLLAPDSGQVSIEGLGNPMEPAVRQRIGVATQAVALYEQLSGEENLRFFGEVYGLSGATLSSRVAWCLDFVGLTDRKGDRVGTYSGGMKRRLNLAAALVHEPDLLLLDEPTVGVDPQSRNKIFENIETLHREGRTIIYTTHYMEEAERLGDRTAYIVIKPGFGTASEQMFYGSPREIELGVDPRRQAEAGMVEGLLMKHASADMQKMFTDPAASAQMAEKALADIKRAPAGVAPQLAPVERFLGELKTFMGSAASAGPGAAAGGSNEWQPLKITAKDVAREYRGPQNAFDITFPQGVIWGSIGCVMTFGISLVTERTHGTLVRLRMAPLNRGQILGGKALACFLSIMLVEVIFVIFVCFVVAFKYTHLMRKSLLASSVILVYELLPLTC
ncbi:MAG: ABC transporter ATP-binding protein [Acidobacteriota bacterium]|nr:ABC transporter ATP-binding protein [Acidobacteriota bacterium]